MTIELIESEPVSPSSSLIPHPSSLLKLHFEYGEATGQTILRVREQQPPLKVVRAFQAEDGAALVHLHNLSGGVLGGDQLGLEVEVGSGARAQLTTTGATRLYRSRKAVLPATQKTVIKVGEGGLLEYLPDPLIPFAGSRYCQQTRIELAQDAGLFWWEMVGPGREARGELFEYELLQLNFDLGAEGRRIALEQVRLEPQKKNLQTLTRLGPYRYFSSFYICRVGLAPECWLRLEAELDEVARQMTAPGEIMWGVSTLAAHGLLVRALALNGRKIGPGLLAFWQRAKLALYGREPVIPRKVY